MAFCLGHRIVNNFNPHKFKFCTYRCFSYEPNVNVDAFDYLCVLERGSCGSDINKLTQIHAQIIKIGLVLEQAQHVATKLVSMYVNHGFLESARHVFDKMHYPYITLWNAIIRGYATTGPPQEALSLYHQMKVKGIQADKFTYTQLLKACSSLSILSQGKVIHGHMYTHGVEQDVYVETALMDMYVKCGCVDYAHQVFDKMPQRNVVSWSALIAGYVRDGCAEEAMNLLCQMQMQGIQPNAVTIANIVSGSTLQQGKLIHAYAIKRGLDLDVSVGTVFLDMYCRDGSVGNARELFDKMPHRNVISWSVMIAGHAHNGQTQEALALFHSMRSTDIKPNKITIINVVSGCSNSAEEVKYIHEYILKNNLGSDVAVVTSLVSLYTKCGCIEIARQLFDGLSEKDVVSWNAMISGYAQNGYPDEAIMLFCKMHLSDMKPNSVTMLIVLPLCALFNKLEQVKWVHTYIIKNGFGWNTSVENVLVDTYAKCGSIESAYIVFEKMYKKDTVSWNTMIAGYAQNGITEKALSLFDQMQAADVDPDQITFVTVLSACADIKSLQPGEDIHKQVTMKGLDADVSIVAALVTMYAKCGRIDVASQLFGKTPERDVVLWNSMIAGYALNGHASEALTIFHQLQLEDIKLNHVTVLSILPACADLGFIHHGMGIHTCIIKNGFDSDLAVQTALITMYAKCASLKAARELFENIPERDVVSWNALIGGYGMHGYGKDAIALFSQMQQQGTKPDSITFVGVLSACSHAGLTEEGLLYFNSMSQDYSITPCMEHYACMIDILGRAGYLDEAYELISKMPFEPDVYVWGALLGACRIHGNIELGEYVSEQFLELEPKNAGVYVSLSNMYAASRKWDGVAKMRKMLNNERIRKIPGCSWIEIKNKFIIFLQETQKWER